ncbi:type II toxin-antitoxin system HicA family toxin (plasmid) [Frigoribacterium sp. NBH87]|uniref:type II toxin-antitoxin system HicA family toxin n=1 Tax=Frigoribacterium sp. NBH87 TaxID=2596916 RepID=UPI00162658DC|nr:type II toxin-antitoxin system HicA family toxin [Frigoribacterium sp. NBH87]QNE45457.1 type II toxin-antitoxin system HicA family toxin [Frigoribacterium sp. NBH87]
MKPQKTRDVVKFLRSIGWVYLRDAPGSHEIWGLPDESVKLSIPTGHKEVSPAILSKLEKRGVTVPKGWK